MIKRTIIVSDIHGALHEMQALLDKLQYCKSADRLILLGDLVDRGRYSKQCVQLAREMDLECVMANHESKFLKWYRTTGGKQIHDRRPYYNEFSDADIAYMENMKPYIKIPELNTVIVHAGLRPGIALSKQSKDDLLYIRYLDADKKFVSLKKIHRLGGVKAAGAHFWTEHGPFGFNVVYGHQVHAYDNIRIDKYDDGTACYGIDTGCCFGGRLTALILETKEVVQVQAKEVYYKPNFEIK